MTWIRHDFERSMDKHLNEKEEFKVDNFVFDARIFNYLCFPYHCFYICKRNRVPDPVLFIRRKDCRRSSFE
jgi:hypothetical protein